MSPTSQVQGHPSTPQEAWQLLLAGNARFVAGEPSHPNQGVDRRGELTGGQAPFATLFGCGDSRVAAEVIFDQGLGDLFVVRTAGHVIHAGVLGSLEFGVQILGTPLIVVLGHDSCGAIKAAISHYDEATMPPGYIRDIVERVTPSVIAAKHRGADSTDEVEAEHVRQTLRLMIDHSNLIRAAVAERRVALVGLTYALSEGKVNIVEVIGNIGPDTRQG